MGAARSDVTDLQNQVPGERKLKVEAILLNNRRAKIRGGGVNCNGGAGRVGGKLRKGIRGRKRLRERSAQCSLSVAAANIFTSQRKWRAENTLEECLSCRLRQIDSVACANHKIGRCTLRQPRESDPGD